MKTTVKKRTPKFLEKANLYFSDREEPILSQVTLNPFNEMPEYCWLYKHPDVDQIFWKTIEEDDEYEPIDISENVEGKFGPNPGG